MLWNAILRKKPRRIDDQHTVDGSSDEPFWVVDYSVQLARQGCDPIVFPITYRRLDGSIRIRFCDQRECFTGVNGTQGMWGTREQKKPGISQSLTPEGWKSEVRRLIGSQRADEIVQEFLDCLETAAKRRMARSERQPAIRQR